ncbi:MAG: MetQ/NlpA family ABC transporter substrate-binding protein [Clostridia bacterium]|nr:MetQ/NlpA family ABC transporter substrate-binding protein [Clostridia bacterium]
MKKILKKITSLVLAVGIVLSVGLFGACSGKNVIKVCASDVPHAEVLNGVVKDILAEKGYKLKVKVLDWTLQNDAVAKGDFDANYFQHIPYLSTYNGKKELFASCKVHYEPLGIYCGKVDKNYDASNGASFEICDDESNAIRAFELLIYYGVIDLEAEGENFPLKVENEETKLNFTGSKWTSKNEKFTVTLIAENLLVASMNDYDYALLPCNTALTGNIDSTKCVAKEDDPDQVSLKANVIAARKDDYNNKEAYKAKIDALTDAMLSEKVSQFFAEKYNGVMTCDSSSQIDLRK